jgi:S-(hydroxymethyl)glutathione dehydrogenase/alcohol dehydrogenase
MQKSIYPLVFKAAILERNNEPLNIDTVTFKGPLEAGQVLVRLHATGICGKQIEEIDGSRGHDQFLPHMLGHEGSGVVVDTGPGVTKVGEGDRVVLHWVKGGGINAATPLYSRGKERVNAGWITTFNEYAVVSENRVTPVDASADLQIACLLGCAATTGVGVIVNDAAVKPGESVVIYGCGGVGMSAIQGAVLTNAYPIIAVDNDAAKLKQAVLMGATHIIQVAEKNVVAEVQQILLGKLADHVILTATHPLALETAVECASNTGKVIFVGVPSAGVRISINPFATHCGRTLRGSFGGGIIPDRDIPRYWSLHTRGVLQLDRLIGKKVPFSKINEGIEAVRAGVLGRCVVSFV